MYTDTNGGQIHVVFHSQDSNVVSPESTSCFFWVIVSLPGRTAFPKPTILSHVSEDVSTLGQEPKVRTPVTLAMTVPLSTGRGPDILDSRIQTQSLSIQIY